MFCALVNKLWSIHHDEVCVFVVTMSVNEEPGRESGGQPGGQPVVKPVTD